MRNTIRQTLTILIATFFALGTYIAIPPAIVVEGVYPVDPPEAIKIYTPEEVEEIVSEYKIEKSDFCYCLRTARNLGAKLPYVDAKDLKRNATPTQGGVIIMKYGDVYHTPYIQFILKGGMWVQEGNYRKCQFTERFIYWDDPAIIGFYYEL
ncbi:hypothetical protein LCGC14_3016910 [marine sediment metagenome]|uniref:Uncharacterized protein n=1 Tax=marine sediment metagenome TaxID=412755 RepID=A0A0F8Z436_9ZZZZ